MISVVFFFASIVGAVDDTVDVDVDHYEDAPADRCHDLDGRVGHRARNDVCAMPNS